MKTLKNKLVPIVFAFAGMLFLGVLGVRIIKGEPLDIVTVTDPCLAGVCSILLAVLVDRKSAGGPAA